MTEKTLIFATLRSSGNFEAEEIIPDKVLENYISRIEYTDLAECQVWEYPSGKIFTIQADRKVSKDRYYSTPYSKHGTNWEPKLIQIEMNKSQVKAAYRHLAGLHR